ncbi:ComF family protein [Bacillaceae bacterium Marseille-Q3522]|nr:ComF family protein [Bacillaceae bacterium Marseille-Q3522]
MKIFTNERCVYCHEELSQKIGWSDLFTKKSAVMLCEACIAKLEEIAGERCEICDRPFSALAERYRTGNRCYDCLRWEEDSKWREVLQKNSSIFVYNTFFQEILNQFKFRGDYQLACAFAPYIGKKLRELEYDYLVPIPLSKERACERGFNQAKALLDACGYSGSLFLSRTYSEKQSKKSRSERIQLPQVFHLQTNLPLNDKRILLIDDVYTTGSTLHHAAKILREAGASSVCSLTLARG